MAYTEQQLESMTDEQLRELALSSIGKPEGELPRDERGRFVKTEEVPPAVEETTEEQTPAPVQEEEQDWYRKEIDLGDGSGKQVFEAATLEELVEKLAEAQKNATRKIRELNRQAKEYKPTPKPTPLTQDEKFVLDQQFRDNPSAAFETLFQRHMGMTIDEFKGLSVTARQMNLERANDQASREWMQTVPDFFACPQNGAKMRAYIEKFHDGIATPESLSAAYTELKGSGLLVDKPATQPKTPAQGVTRVRRSSHIQASTVHQAPPAAPKTEADKQAEVETALDNMSDAEFKAFRANRRGW